MRTIEMSIIIFINENRGNVFERGWAADLSIHWKDKWCTQLNHPRKTSTWRRNTWKTLIIVGV
jgi:hypothetical protein